MQVGLVGGYMGRSVAFLQACSYLLGSICKCGTVCSVHQDVCKLNR